MSGMKKISAREKREKEEKQTALIFAAINNDCITRSDIKEATNIKLHEINNLFLSNAELYAEFVVRRKTIVDKAADNIHDIVDDKFHPNNYAASKFILNKYKSDFDTILIPAAEIEIPLGMGGNNITSPVKIIFGKPKLIEIGTKEDNEIDI